MPDRFGRPSQLKQPCRAARSDTRPGTGCEIASRTKRYGLPRPHRPPASIVVQDHAGAAVLGEQRVAAVAEQVEVERLVGLLLAVALDLDGDSLRRLAG